MKRMFLAILLSVLIAVTAGCGTKSKDTASSDIKPTDADSVKEKGQVVFLIDSESLTAKGMRLTVQNHSDDEVTFGSEYSIQKYKDGGWNEVEEIEDNNWCWTLILYCVEGKGKSVFDLDWYCLYGELSPGKYRIVKEYQQGEDACIGYCEFEIN